MKSSRRTILNLLRKVKLGEFYTDGVLVTNVAAEISNNPDGIFVSRDSLKKDRVKLVPRKSDATQYIELRLRPVELEGAPDCVMEVISKSSVTKDTKELYAAYHQAGIDEYWLIDARGKDIDFTIYHWQKKGYVAAPRARGWQPSRVFGHSFRLRRQRDDLGFWQYTLTAKKA